MQFVCYIYYNMFIAYYILVNIILQIMQLYTFFRSSTAWRARIAVNLKKLNVQYKYVHLFKGQQRNSQYQKINPNTGVPSLILPTGQILIESMAIIQYLNQIYPQPYDLFPGSPIKRAQIRGFCQVINSGIHPYQNLHLVQKMHGKFGVDKKQWCVDWVTRGLVIIQKLLKSNQARGIKARYVFGDEVTAADVFLYPQVLAARDRWKIDLSPYGQIFRISKSLQDLKEFVNANPQNQKDYEE